MSNIKLNVKEDGQIEYDFFISHFKPIKNTIDTNAAFDGFMFETYGQEYELVKENIENETVWTILDDGEGGLFLGAGHSWVNRLGYIITNVPWTDICLYVDDF